MKAALIAVALAVAAFASNPVDLRLDAPIDSWDEAIPLGNGLTGGLLWGAGNEIRVSLDRGDLWDLRPHPAFVRSGFNYSTVVKLATAGKTEELNTEYSRASDYPAKLPGGRLVLTLDPQYQAEFLSLDLKRAVGSVELGSGRLDAFFSATQPVALLFVPCRPTAMKLIANEAVKTLGYQVAQVQGDEHSVWFVQRAADSFEYAILVNSRPDRNGTLIAIAITTNRDGADALAMARRTTEAALKLGFDKQLASHVQWWTSFWNRSWISVPDESVQLHYNLVQYFYGAASRPPAPPIPLQGVWTADQGRLPPWHGDYHHDLNTQLTYWAYLASGHFDEGRAFIDFMWNLKPRHEQFARSFYGVEKGFIVPGVMSLDGTPMGSWFQYTLSPTMGAWVAQSFYWHWRYTMDTQFLGGKAYPYCAGIGEALACLLKPDPQTGRLKLPLSTSPEIHNNWQKAWLNPNSNFDQALLRWLFAANAEMATALGRGPEAVRWNDLLDRLGPLAIARDTGLLVAPPDEPLQESHRHHSHLMAIHPLGNLNIEGDQSDRKAIADSFREVDRLGTLQWTGYSFSWMAAMRARAGRGDEALRFLKDYLDSFIVRNGFHVNGEQTKKGLSDYHYKAFTLEGNFAAAQAVHEMLLQSWGGRIRVFPAMPASWREASFDKLRAEGGFSVTAERHDGRTTKVTVQARIQQTLRLKDPFDGRPFTSSRPVQQSGTEIRATLKPGATLTLTETRPR